MIVKNLLVVGLTLIENHSEFMYLMLNTWRGACGKGEVKKGMHSGSVAAAVTSSESREKREL